MVSVLMKHFKLYLIFKRPMVVLNFYYYLNVQRKDKVISMKYSGESKLAYIVF